MTENQYGLEDEEELEEEDSSMRTQGGAITMNQLFNLLIRRMHRNPAGDDDSVAEEDGENAGLDEEMETEQEAPEETTD